MEAEELKNIWQAYEIKLEKSLKLNIRCIEEIQSQKAKSKLKPILLLRIFEIIVHVFVMYFLAKFLYRNLSYMQYAAPAAVLISFYAIALSNCIRQIIIIKQIDYSKSVADIQKKLNLLQLHIVNYVRLTFLCIPTYLAYPIILFRAFTNFDILSKLHGSWWTGQIIFTIILIPICIWLYRKVNYKNIDKKWVRFIIKNSAGTAVTKAMDFTNEIDEFKKGLA
jgi:hypothetical protein